MSDCISEWRLFPRTLNVNVYPLMILSDISKSIYHALRNVLPITKVALFSQPTVNFRD